MSRDFIEYGLTWSWMPARVQHFISGPESSVVVAFRLHGTHVGAYHSALGEMPASGRTFAMQVIDILRFHDGRIASIRMVADEAGLLAHLPG